MSGPFIGRSRRRHADEPMKSQFVNQLLSLFIMLVAFFIVLNSISIYDKGKSQSAKQSLGGTFAGSEQDGILMPLNGSEQASGDVLGLHGVQGEGDSFDSRVSGLFTSIIPAGQPAQKNERGALYLHLTEREFEAALDKKDGPFGKALAAVIRNAEEGQPYHMAIAVNLGTNPAEVASQTPETAAALSARFDRIAAQIEGAGLSPALFSIGAAGGEKDTVDLIFRPAAKIDPMAGNKLSEGL
jgi:hypothetical protein